MKIQVTKEKIVNVVSLVEKITGKKESLPVLSCILLEVGKDISLRATNLEAGIDVRLPGDISEKGVVAIPAIVFSQTLKSINSDKITLTIEDNNLIIEAKGTKTLIKAIPHEEFPPLSVESESKKGVSVVRDRFMKAIQSVSYAASPSMIRPELGSIYVSIQDGTITCVATDSFRLAEKKIVGAAGNTDVELLIPLKHASELVHVLERIGSEKIDLYADDSQMVVSSDGIRYISRVVEGNFPNYKDIIPKNFDTEATVLKNDLSEMLRKARVFSGSDQHVGFHIYPKKKICSATAQSADVGEMSDSIDAALSGADIDINFHIGYLADCLSSIDSDSVTLSFAGPSRPLVVRGVSDSSFLYLVMPLNR